MLYCMVLFQIEDEYNSKGESELYTGIKICFFGIHSWMDLEKLSLLTEFKGVLTYTNTQTFQFFFKKGDVNN